MHDVLTGAAAGLQHVAGLAHQEFLQRRPDRRVVAMECRSVEPPIGLDPPAVLAELDDKLRHMILTHVLHPPLEGRSKSRDAGTAPEIK